MFSRIIDCVKGERLSNSRAVLDAHTEEHVKSYREGAVEVIMPELFALIQALSIKFRWRWIKWTSRDVQERTPGYFWGVVMYPKAVKYGSLLIQSRAS